MGLLLLYPSEKVKSLIIEGIWGRENDCVSNQSEQVIFKKQICLVVLKSSSERAGIEFRVFSQNLSLKVSKKQS